MAEGRSDLAPKRVRLELASMDKTTPIAEPARATSGTDFEPMSSSWRMSSRHSKGGVTAARTTCHVKRPSSPNHAKNPPMRPGPESTTGRGAAASCGRSASLPLVKVSSPLLKGLDLNSVLYISIRCIRQRREDISGKKVGDRHVWGGMTGTDGVCQT